MKDPRKDLKIQDLELNSVLATQLGRNSSSTSSLVSAKNEFQRQFWPKMEYSSDSSRSDSSGERKETKKSNLSRRNRGAEAMRRFIANQIEEERISTYERKRQRMAQINTGKAAKRRRRIRSAETMQRLIADQTGEERASTNERRRQNRSNRNESPVEQD
ncbi:unnamed protein product [Onchocerca ochengi]|uniref:BZIP domain-containing protein n=1 Tax=Onchocerca ochengi TaxID=42157 RepID=A0A182EPP6_ONCOC|nr:unnamed protein product [Onchocerca ochengi]